MDRIYSSTPARPTDRTFDINPGMTLGTSYGTSGSAFANGGSSSGTGGSSYGTGGSSYGTGGSTYSTGGGSFNTLGVSSGNLNAPSNNLVANQNVYQVPSQPPRQRQPQLSLSYVQTPQSVMFEPAGYSQSDSNMGASVNFNDRSRDVAGDYAPMSTEFLKMKQNQEKEALLNRGDANSVSLERLKVEQALELQRNLQGQNYFKSNLQGFNSGQGNDYASISGIPSVSQTCAYNAQGQAIADSSSLQKDKLNKYEHLKQMSPEMLNRLYGRPSDQSVLPPTTDMGSGDIYDQTCYTPQSQLNPVAQDQLKTQVRKRQEEIMGQRTMGGIQSWNDGGFGTNLNDAYQQINLQISQPPPSHSMTQATVISRPMPQQILPLPQPSSLIPHTM